jgi:hypothetical protein
LLKIHPLSASQHPVSPPSIRTIPAIHPIYTHYLVVITTTILLISIPLSISFPSPIIIVVVFICFFDCAVGGAAAQLVAVHRQ